MIGDMHNRQAITPRRLWNAIRDVDLWPLYLLGLTIYVPMVPMNSYITLILKSIGFDTVHHSPLPSFPNGHPLNPPVHNKPPCNPLQRRPHPPPPRHNPSQRIPQLTRPRRHPAEYLDAPLHRSIAFLAGNHGECMGHVCARHGADVLPILPCDCRRVGFEEFE